MPGAIIYQGPSVLDKAPIFVTAVWTGRKSNRKTGDMLQTYIMRSDLDPLLANKLGEDESVCGQCRHRGTPTLDPDRSTAQDRSCYVSLLHGPLIVWKGFLAGRYPYVAPGAPVRALGAGRKVRLGTYGDPAAAPLSMWRQLLRDAEDWTGYSHNDAPGGLCMTSADSLPQARKAWRAGQRTFRVMHDVNELQSNEVLCPASAEAGHRTTCQACMLCNGSKQAKSVAIVAHGSGKKHF